MADISVHSLRNLFCVSELCAVSVLTAGKADYGAVLSRYGTVQFNIYGSHAAGYFYEHNLRSYGGPLRI